MSSSLILAIVPLIIVGRLQRVDALIADERKRILFERREPLRFVLPVSERLRLFLVHGLRGRFERRHGVPLTMALTLSIAQRVLAGPRFPAELRGLVARVGQRDDLDTAEPEVTPLAFRANLAPPDPTLRPRTDRRPDTSRCRRRTGPAF
jgi:hypothetical protein